MSSVGDLTISELAGRATMYRPVVLTVVLVLGVLRVLPDRQDVPTPSDVAQATMYGGNDAATPATTSSTSPTTTRPVDPPPVPSAFSVPATQRALTGPPAPIGPSPSVTTTTTTTVPSGGTTPTSTPTRPRVVATAWASATAGTPLADTGVPAGTLPVGTRFGERDKVSFLRFDIDPGTVRLSVDTDGDRGIEEPAIRACTITTPDWQPGEALAFDDAPQWDPERCVDGASAGDTWTFDVAGLDRTNGLALVPSPDAPVDFQVTFRADGGD